MNPAEFDKKIRDVVNEGMQQGIPPMMAVTILDQTVFDLRLLMHDAGKKTPSSIVKSAIDEAFPQ